MKKILLLLSVFVMASCSKEEPVEAPTDGTSQIETNNEIIKSYEEHLVDAQEKYDNAELPDNKDVYEESIRDWEARIESLEMENELLEDTLIYNDEFKIVQGTGVYIQQTDGILTEEDYASSFSRDALQTLDKYKDEITDGAILIGAAPFETDGDKFPVISVYYTQESLGKINFDRASDDEREDYLYKNADYVTTYDTLAEYITNRGSIDDVPDLFLHYSGTTY